MECRIESKSEASRTVVAISGRLSGDVIEKLREVRRSIEGAVTLDLASLFAADEEGLETIRAMSLEGDEIRNPSPLVQLLLQDDPRG